MAKLSKVLALCIGTGWIYGYNFGALNLPVELVKEFYNATYTDRGSPLTSHMSTFLSSFTVTVFLAGSFFGTLFGGSVSKRIGRKKLVLLCQIPHIIGSILQTICVVINSPETLMIGRFVSGLGSGIALQILPVYVSEISPQSIRGAMVSGNGVIAVVGIICSSILGLDKCFGTQSLWVYILLMPIIPSVISTLLLLNVVESPRYLLLDKDNQTDAEKALQFLRQREDVSSEIEAIKNEAMKGEDTVKYTFLGLLKSKEYHLPLLLIFLVPLSMQTTAMTGIFLYTPGILQNIGLTKEEIQYSVVGMYSSMLFGTILAVYLIDKIGRRPLLLYTMSAITVILLIMGLSSHFQNHAAWLSYIGVVSAILFCVFVTLGPGSVTFVIPPELFKQGPRDVANSFSLVSIWVTTLVFAVTFEFIAEALGSFVFILFMGLTLGFTLFFFWKLPETKNKTVQEITDMLNRKKSISILGESETPFNKAQC